MAGRRHKYSDGSELYSMIIILLFLSSCVLQIDYDEPTEEELYNYAVWISRNINWELTDDWRQTPAQTLDRGEGDCLDMTLLMLMYAREGSVGVIEGYEMNHCVAIIRGKIYDPSYGIIIDWDINIAREIPYRRALFYTGVLVL